MKGAVACVVAFMLCAPMVGRDVVSAVGRATVRLKPDTTNARAAVARPMVRLKPDTTFGRATNARPTPQRIISLIPAVTEMLFAIGAGPRVVAVSSFDKYPPEVTKLQKVGALLDPDLERILALAPDLVVIYGSQTDLQQQLERARIPVYVYRHAGLPDVTTTLRQIGERVGLKEAAAALATNIESRVGEIRTRVGGRPRPKTLIVIGREAGSLRGIYASGGVGFIHDMVDAAGGDNVFADVRQQAVQATTELILARRPDVILELRGDLPSPDEIRRDVAVWQGVRSVPAVRSGRVQILGDERTVVPGSRVAEGVELIARALHPDAFRK